MAEILYDERALRELRRLAPEIRRRILSSIEAKLLLAPQDFGKPLRGSLKGDWSLRVGDWRVLYRIEKDRVIVARIGHRSEAYLPE